MADLIHLIYGKIRWFFWLSEFRRRVSMGDYPETCDCRRPSVSGKRTAKLAKAKNEDEVVDLLAYWYNLTNWKRYNCILCETYPQYIQFYLQRHKEPKR